MHELVETLLEAENVDPAFRVWITTEVHAHFPITLLQMSIKFTNEPPLGVRAGLKRTYTGMSRRVTRAATRHLILRLSFSHHSGLPRCERYDAVATNVVRDIVPTYSSTRTS